MGKTILVSSHILPELADICNKIGIIERGELIFDGTVDSAIKQVRKRTIYHVAVAHGQNDRAKESLAQLRTTLVPGTIMTVQDRLLLTTLARPRLYAVLLGSFAARYSPDELALYLLDFKEGVSFAGLAPKALPV